jgi:thioredoxin reductase (NADPH)
MRLPPGRVACGTGVDPSGNSPLSRPVILAVDDEPDALAQVEHELRRRFGADYRIVCSDSGEAALATLEALRAGGAEVAVVLADQWMPGTSGTDLLARVGDLHPDAKRGLLIRWGDWADRPTADAVLQAMARGRIDYYVLKPWRARDELFHRTIAELVHEWSRGQPSGGDRSRWWGSATRRAPVR